MQDITINGVVFKVNSVVEIIDSVHLHLDVNTGYIILVNVIEQGYKTTEEFIKFLNS
jgi:hypothetical protein